MLTLYKKHLYVSVRWVNLGGQVGSLLSHCSFQNELIRALSGILKCVHFLYTSDYLLYAVYVLKPF